MPPSATTPLDPAGDATGSDSITRNSTTGGTTGWLWVTGGSAGTQTLTDPLPGWQNIFLNELPASLDPIPIIIGTRFPDGGWDPLLKAGAIAAAFAAGTDWTKECDPGLPDDTAETLKAEEQILLNKNPPGAPIDPDRLDEIIAQAQDFSPYWANLLSCSAASRPATWSVVLVALQVAGLVVAYFKLKYERARPAQVWTAISPVIPTPAHPSYPGGHALQAHLIAKCVEWIVPAMRPACKVLATRIAENRELAGLHWPSDTEASVKIVQRTFELLSGVEQFIEIVKIAKDEWGTPTEFSPPTPPHVGDTKVPLS